MANKYIKSHSNYVLKSKHQNTKDGTIFERDITTIGGRDQFAKGQVPIYKSGNFVITVNNENNSYNKTSDKGWYNSIDGEIWSLKTLENYEKDEKTSYDKKIVVKKDYLDIRDYAYYGSCSELIRVSIDDIIKNYPGELFIPYETIYVAKDKSGAQYTEEAAKAAFGEDGYTIERTGIKGYYTSMEEKETRIVKDSCDKDIELKTVSLIDPLTDQEREELKLGIPYTREFKYITDKHGKVKSTKSLSLIDNPFDINIHSNFVPSGYNPLRYFAEGGINNYVGYLKLNDSGEIDVNADWKIDPEHAYSLAIEEITLDGLSEEERIEYFFDVIGGNCPNENCEAQVTLNLTAHKETEKNTGCVLTCPDPGKYIGKITICFKNTDYVFKTIPGLQMGDDGKPINTCCGDNALDFPADGGEGKYNGNDTQIESLEKTDCKYRLTIYMFMGNNNEIKYFVEDSLANFVWRIRPNDRIIDDYFNNLDSFEKILLNRDSDPLYTSKFELISDNDYGMYTYTKEFTFPTTYGGWNLGSHNNSFNEYISTLTEIGEYYDELFTDNLWRSLTHESIKNFDWTYSRHFTPGEENPYSEAGTRIKKAIRLFGREFDEIKSFIEAIDDFNVVTYDDINNLPDYFFTDKLEEQGWDIKPVHPLELTETLGGYGNFPIDINKFFTNKYNDNGDRITTEQAEKLNYFYDSNNVTTRNKIEIKRSFKQKDEHVKPYSISNITTKKHTKYIECNPEEGEEFNTANFKTTPFVSRNNDGLPIVGNCIGKLTFSAEGGYGKYNGNDIQIDSFVDSELVEDVANGYHNDFGEIIRIYSNEKYYSSSDVNTEFIKRLLINSPDIFRHKGTIDGIEMILSMFGLKSKNRVYTDERYFTNQKGLRQGNCLSLTKEGETYYKNYADSLYNIYDFDIKEYTLFTTREEDEWLPTKNMYKYDWINSTKLVSYNYLNEYQPYQGLPVCYKEVVDGDVKKRYLYPQFNTYDVYDGNPYYQMNGGWLCKKPFMFDADNNILMDGHDSENRGLFTETVKNIKCVDSLEELLSNQSLAEKSGDICQVTDLSKTYAIIDGILYPIIREDDEENSNLFIYVTTNDGYLTVGNAVFSDYVVISNPYFENKKQKIVLNEEYYYNREIKIYILKDINGEYYIDAYSTDSSISTFTVFENGKYMKGDNYTNYFRLNNIDFYNELSALGWQQLKNDEYEYYKLNTIVDDREGNNPHTGHMKYDNGHEYLTYFQRIFKHVLDNDLIDYRKYSNDDMSYLEGLENFGFKNIIDEDVCNIDYDSHLKEDNKCHYFGGVMVNDSERHNLSCFEKENIRKAIVDDSLGSKAVIKNLMYGDGDEYDKSIVDNETHQIVNTKRVEIEFYIKNNHEYSKEWLEEVKYIDSVVLPYLTQMIPSTIIWSVKYVTRGVEPWDNNNEC